MGPEHREYDPNRVFTLAGFVRNEWSMEQQGSFCVLELDYDQVTETVRSIQVRGTINVRGCELQALRMVAESTDPELPLVIELSSEELVRLLTVRLGPLEDKGFLGERHGDLLRNIAGLLRECPLTTLFKATKEKDPRFQARGQ
eukprot:GHVU01004123.1.p1 GENE.GHVU01004123.1~~GHVU01004123.1.p1  ORF type:complete len:144 (+),score=9.19 GHVU01004123.1:357-788(+)